MNKKQKQIKQRREKILAELGVRTDDGMRYCRNHSLYGEWPKSIPAACWRTTELRTTRASDVGRGRKRMSRLGLRLATADR
jgi:hypothetical protein